MPEPAHAVTVADAVGDVRVGEDRIVPAPGFLDIASMAVRVDGNDLDVTLTLNGDVADAASTSKDVSYGFWVEGPTIGSTSWYWIEPSSGWGIMDVFRFDFEPIGYADPSGDQIRFRVPRPSRVAAEKLRFAGSMTVSDLRLPDPDEIPDLRGRDRTDRTPQPAEPSPTPRVIELPWERLDDSVPDLASGSTNSDRVPCCNRDGTMGVTRKAVDLPL